MQDLNRLGQLVDTHLVIYILFDNQFLIWRDYRLNFTASSTRYFVLKKNQHTVELRESRDNLDRVLNPPTYFFVLTNNFLPVQSDNIVTKIFKLCRTAVAAEQISDSLGQLKNVNHLAAHASELFELLQQKVLVVSYKGTSGRAPTVRTTLKNLVTPARCVFQTVCVIAPAAQLVSMQLLDVKNIDMVICIFGDHQFCQLSPAFADKAKAMMLSQINSDVIRDRVETLEVGVGGPNPFAQTKAEERESKEKVQTKKLNRNKCNQIVKHCRCKSCHQETEFNCNMSGGGPEKLLTHKLTLQDLALLMGERKCDIDFLLDQLSCLSVAAFDIESMTVKLDHRMAEPDLPFVDIDNTAREQHALALQKPIMLAHRDGLMSPEDPCQVFTLEQEGEAGVYKLLRTYWKYVLKRQKLVMDKKKELAAPLLELCSKYEAVFLEYAQHWEEPGEEAERKLKLSDLVSAWKCSLPGRLQQQLQKICERYEIFSFYGSGYDHVLLESYLVPYLFEKRLKPKVEKKGNKVISIGVVKTNITFRDVVRLLAPGTSLKQFGQLFNLNQEKAHFPFSLLTGIESLSLPQLPADVSQWQSDLSISKAPLTQAEVDEAQRLFRVSGCQNVGDYLKTYLKLDVDILYQATQGWRATMKKELDLDFVLTGNFTISSVSNLAGDRCASKHLQIGQFFPNSAPVYRLLRKGMRG